MSIARTIRKNRVRYAFTLGAVVLSVGGLILLRAPGHGAIVGIGAIPTAAAHANGKNLTTFQADGAKGVLALSHTKVLANTGKMYAELTIEGDKSAAKQRAPMSLAVVLDVSGSMSGEKIEDAKQATVKLIQQMQADDEIAIIKYSSDAQVVQSLSRVGKVREDAVAKVKALAPEGGTNIPSGLSKALEELREVSSGRVKRIVLASDGIDSSEIQARQLTSDGFEKGITISSLGIGLDFNEAYMSSISRAGHGNFAFVAHNGSLEGFLKQELDESATTVVDQAKVKIRLPKGVKYVRAVGADVKTLDDNAIEVKLGSLFSGDERRATLEFETDIDSGKSGEFAATATWKKVGGSDQSIDLSKLTVASVSDSTEVAAGLDGTVMAHVTSSIASERQIEAATAYAKGDTTTATRLMRQNRDELAQARAMAPAEEAARLGSQSAAYDRGAQAFAAAAPSSVQGKAAAKSMVMFESKNLSKKATY